ncbi:MAG TPA: hypothetical protein VGM83_01690 [Devosiaceae bacterium]|jgi:hypothetical protein
MVYQESDVGAVSKAPLTPAMKTCLLGERKINPGFLAIGVPAVLVLAYVLFPPLLSWVLQSVSHIAVAVVGLCIVICLPILWGRLKIAADLKAAQFSRYSGAFVIRRHSQPAQGQHPSYWPFNRSFTWALQLPQGEIVLPSFVVTEMQQAGRGTIDFAPNSKTIFEVRDTEGRVLFRHPNYQA